MIPLNIVVVILLLIIAVMVAYWVSCRQKRLEFAKSPPIVLDVRTAEEFNSGHMPGAININTPSPPLDAAAKSALKQKLCRELNVPKQYPILVYCKKGIRAAEALRVLYGMGYTNVISLGGITTPPLVNWMPSS